MTGSSNPRAPRIRCSPARSRPSWCPPKSAPPVGAIPPGTAAPRRARRPSVGAARRTARWDGLHSPHATLKESLADDASSSVLMVLAETLIRLGRTDEAISAGEWAVKLAPYQRCAHYLLGNGYARKNYTQLVRRLSGGVRRRRRAQRLIARRRRSSRRGQRDGRARRVRGARRARTRAGSTRACGSRRSISRTAASRDARDGCFAALATCPEYGRAHAVLAKALEAQRLRRGRAPRRLRAALRRAPDARRAGHRDASCANWNVALAAAPEARRAVGRAVEGSSCRCWSRAGSTYYIKPLYMLLSECPNLETLRDHAHQLRLAPVGRRARLRRLSHRDRHRGRRAHDLRPLQHRAPRADAPGARRAHRPTIRASSRSCYRHAKERDDADEGAASCRATPAAACTSTSPKERTRCSAMRDAYDPREVRCAAGSHRSRSRDAGPEAHVAATDVSLVVPDRVRRPAADDRSRLEPSARLAGPCRSTARRSAVESDELETAHGSRSSNALVLGGTAPPRPRPSPSAPVAARRRAATASHRARRRRVARGPPGSPLSLSRSSSRASASHGPRTAAGSDISSHQARARGSPATRRAGACWPTTRCSPTSPTIPAACKVAPWRLALAGRARTRRSASTRPPCRFFTGVVEASQRLRFRSLLREPGGESACSARQRRGYSTSRTHLERCARGQTLKAGRGEDARRQALRAVVCDLARIVLGAIDAAREAPDTQRGGLGARETSPTAPPGYVFRQGLDLGRRSALPAVERDLLSRIPQVVARAGG